MSKQNEKRAPKSDAERLVSRYLEENGWKCQYEAEVGRKRPDFSLWRDDLPVAIWEVGERTLDVQDKAELERICQEIDAGRCTSSEYLPDSFGFIQMKIKYKSGDFANYGAVPSALVLVDLDNRVDLSPQMLLNAMSGWPAIKVAFGDGGGISDAIHGDDGRMICDAYWEGNRSISAIASPVECAIDMHRSGYTAMCDELLHELYAYEEYLNRCEVIASKLVEEGYDFDRTVTTMHYVLNPNASVEWPMAFVGKFDRVYRQSSDPFNPDVVYDGWSSGTF